MIMLKRVLHWFLRLSVFYVFFIGVVYLVQEKAIYHPDTNKPNIKVAQEITPNITEVTYALPNKKEVFAWYLPAPKNEKIVVFFHGNSRNLERNLNQLNFFKKQNVGFFMPEYEGFGSIEGRLMQAELEQDVKAALLWLLDKGYKPQDIIIYGHSLGTYLAVYSAAFMAQEHQPVSAVVLEAPFYSLEYLAKKKFGWAIPVSLLLKDKFQSNELIAKIKAPLFVGHGKKDKIIPYDQGLKLYRNAHHEKTFFSSDLSDHNTLPQNGFIEFVFGLLKK